MRQAGLQLLQQQRPLRADASPSCCVRTSLLILAAAQSVKDMPIVQDMPPVGGFPSIRIQRRLPSTGPTGVAIFAVGGAVMAYGYYQVCLRYTSALYINVFGTF